MTYASNAPKSAKPDAHPLTVPFNAIFFLQDSVPSCWKWWGENPQPGYVSIEQDYAEWLDLELGDRLEFEINQQTVYAEVSNFRSVRWDNMQPNFFIIFSPGTIDHLGGTYLSTALMEQEQKILLNELVQRFPTIVVIEIDAQVFAHQDFHGFLLQYLDQARLNRMSPLSLTSKRQPTPMRLVK